MRAAGAAILVRHRGAAQPRRARLGPDVAIVDAGLVPPIEMRNEFVGNKPPRLLLEQDEIFAHPCWSREVYCFHWATRLSCTIRPSGYPREELLPLVLLAELTARRMLSFCRVLDVLDRIKLDVADRAVDFLHPTNVDVLHNVTRVRIN